MGIQRNIKHYKVFYDHRVDPGVSLAYLIKEGKVQFMISMSGFQCLLHYFVSCQGAAVNYDSNSEWNAKHYTSKCLKSIIIMYFTGPV